MAIFAGGVLLEGLPIMGEKAGRAELAPLVIHNNVLLSTDHSSESLGCGDSPAQEPENRRSGGVPQDTRLVRYLPQPVIQNKEDA
jgi:hypothetical protein